MKIQVLDQGYIELIEHWGSDERIIEAARMSTSKGFQGWGPQHATNCSMHPDLLEWSKSVTTNKLSGIKCTCEPKPGDEKLLKFLYTHNHTTPFEMAGAIIEVQAPIFVFREWHRHRTQSYNELSARYTELPNMFYVPSLERAMNSKQDTKNKQGSKEGFSLEQAESIQDCIEAQQQACRTVYEELLRLGVSKEVARLVIPVAQYSKMRASANLLNWIRFLRLRCAKNAQYEIREYANQLSIILEQKFPRTMHLFLEEQDAAS